MATGRWTHHCRDCRDCRGSGQVERQGRRALRQMTEGRVFRHPPEHLHGDQQTHGLGGLPLAGRHPGGRPRRRPPSPPRPVGGGQHGRER
ncbi:MAG: hypothetical protein ACRDRK_06480 [Pseudonocardia sp.]